jgi:hypothetical protein
MNNNFTGCSGKFFFSPKREGLKKTHRSFDRGIILKVDNGITDYYSWWLWRKYGIRVSKPAWGTHVTVVSDRDRVRDIAAFEQLKKELDSTYVKLHYNVNIEKHWHFWVLPVIPNHAISKIRNELGLRNDYPFHITIGRDDHDAKT